MKLTLQKIITWALFLTLLFAVQSAYAQQGFDVTKHVADPRSKVFSDGKNTVQNYIQYQLENNTNCCGMDDLYIEVKYDKNGVVTSARVLTSNSECNKKAVPDIVKYIRWKVEDPNNLRPVYLGMRPSIPCKGTDKDNVYEPISAPAGFDAGEYADNNTTSDDGFDDGSDEQTADTDTPSEDAQPEAPESDVAKGQSDTDEEPAPEESMAENNVEEPAAPTPNETAPTETAPSQPDMADAATADPQSEVPKGQSDPDAGLQQGASEATGDTAGIEIYELEEPSYTAQNLKPNEEHIETHMNTSGPSASVSFGLSQTKTALYVKKNMREMGICGLAHVLVEMRMEKDGSISGVRFLKYNDEKVRDAAVKILQGMKFTATASYRTYPIFEFKTYIDCTTMNQKGKLDEVPDYFIAPGEEGKKRQNDMNNQDNQGGEDPNDVTLPTDE
ncbi:MAG: hypothetical protein ACOCZ8_04325 [Bacteroidota bacterium]